MAKANIFEMINTFWSKFNTDLNLVYFNCPPGSVNGINAFTRVSDF